MNDVRYRTIEDWACEFDKEVADLIGEILPVNPLLAEMVWRPSSDRYGHELVPRVTGARTGADGENPRYRYGMGMVFAPGVTSLSRKMENTVFHGNMITRPEDWMGLSAFYNSRTEALNGVNILDAGGTENVFSMWLVGWSGHTCFGFFPPNTPIGLAVHGPRQWCAGIGLADWRFIARVANIPAGMPDDRLLDFLGRALGLMPSLTKEISFAFYCNEIMKERLPDRFGGIPIRSVAALNASEARI